MIYIFIFNLNINSLERQDSIQELRNMVAQLSHKLGSFEDSHARTEDVNLESHARTEDVNLERSLSPVLNRNKGRNKHLSPMSCSYKKTLRVCYIFIIKIFIFYLIFNWLCFFAIFKQDEVVQIISNLNPNLLFDVAKTFANQKKIINKKLLPAIKSAMNPSLEAYDVEILSVIKQLHKSRQKIWKLQDEGWIDKYNKRQHMTSRRDQVRNLLIYLK